jgi:hypothetical protein
MRPRDRPLPAECALMVMWNTGQRRIGVAPTKPWTAILPGETIDKLSMHPSSTINKCLFVCIYLVAVVFIPWSKALERPP